ncbi:MAG: type II toxin-antitoxin system death-on-curing family toxin [Planctomycetia bacterium]|nr:type II toxin-antitoxin system death-on-curing family toxin [Planctomycetia bacterium]
MSDDSIVFLTLERVLAIHQRVLDEYGGPAGLRDQNLLDSALAVPKSSFGGEFFHTGLPAMAAAYLFHICKNHPFVDGNKRCALATAIQFLYLNGRMITADKASVEKLTWGVADGSVSKETATKFFKRHVRKTPRMPKSDSIEKKPPD